MTSSGAERPVPPEHLYRFIGGKRIRCFSRTGDRYLEHFKRLCELRPHERVLDVGCGPGRMALPLTDYMSAEGSYEGFDIAPDLVDWCNEHIASAHPNFSFRRVDIFNRWYNPSGQLSASEFEFPYGDDEFDLAIVASVFTHMLPDDVEHYLSELARVIKPGGRMLATYFLLNEESLRLLEGGGAAETFDHDFGNHRLSTLEFPEAVIAYDEQFVLELQRHAGLDARAPVHYGKWRGRESALDWQDLLVADRRG